MRPIFLKQKKDIGNPKDQRTGTITGCSRTNNPGVTRKPYYTFKRIRNPIPWNPDDPLKVIQNLVPNGIRSQWPIGLTVPD